MLNKNSSLLYLFIIPILFITNWFVKHLSLFYDFSSTIFLILNIIIILSLVKGDFKIFLIIISLSINFSYRIYFQSLSISYLGFLYIYFILLFLYFLIKKRQFMTNENKILFLLIMYSILVTSGIGARDYISYVFNLFGGFIIFQICSNINDRNLRISKFILLLPLIFSPLILYEIIYKPSWGGVYHGSTYRIFGTLDWPNSFALYLNIIIMFILSIYMETRKKNYLIILFIYTLFLINTFSRSGILAFILGISIILMLKNYRFIIKMKSVITVSIIFGMAILGLEMFSHTRLTRIGIEAIKSDRVYIWNQVYYNIEDNLAMGSGLGGYEGIRSNISAGLSAHNMYLFLISNIGIVGLILFIILYIYIFINIYKIMIYNNNYKIKIFARGVIANAVIMLFVGLVGNAPISILYTFIFWAMTGFIYNNKESYVN